MTTLRLYLISGVWTFAALFGLGIACWAAFFLIEGAVAFGGGSLLHNELVALPFTFLLFIAASFTFGAPYMVPLIGLGGVLFWGLSQFARQSRLLAISSAILTSWAAGLYVYRQDIQDIPGQSPIPAAVLFTLMGVIAGGLFWVIFCAQRDRSEPSAQE